ncbi:tlc lipid binding domain-like protein [Dermatophagoides farinae]|uniref:Tlc lipid binding domain-like protein n=1 Tax=Dermatophagoides farinae TaxID=6954 RepID=A0A9D4P4Y6_DERFA|nr:tlc lipid binding domain-like protein [Dermatophagoides farinae]
MIEHFFNYLNQFWFVHRLIFIDYPNYLRTEIDTTIIELLIQCLWKLFLDNNFFIRPAFILSLSLFIVSFIRSTVVTSIVSRFVQNGIVAENDARKFYECFWCFLCHLLTFAVTWIVVNSNNCLLDPKQFWSDMNRQSIPILYGFIFAFKTSFYIDSTYSMMYVYVSEKMTPIYMIHHMTTISLLILSYMTKNYLNGITIIYLFGQDTLLMQFSKCIIRIQLQIIQRNRNLVRRILFYGFATLWMYNRIYRYPLIIIPELALFASKNFHLDWSILGYILILLLWIILVVSLFWTVFIVKIVSSTLLDQKDIYHLDVQDSEQQQQQQQQQQKNAAAAATADKIQQT